MDCGFVGLYRDWDYFLSLNKANLKWRSRTRAMFKNGDRWTWIPKAKDCAVNVRGHFWDRILLPRDIDYDLFLELHTYALRYYTRIEWYKDFNFEKGENK